MQNIGLINLKNKDVNNFTSEFGLKMRKVSNKPIRFFLKCFTNGKIIVESYPNLKKDQPYIFASTHSFVEEISTILSTIDRSTYTLCGTTDQFEHNPKMYANWLTGLIYVDRESEKSRKEAIPKMEKILKSGTSVLIFPEGGWNNTENLLCQELFSSPYILSKDMKIPVIPISTFNEYGSKMIYINVGEPINLYELDKKNALIMLRDALSTMQYLQIENYSTKFVRNYNEDIRLKFMEERKNEYLKTKWTKDVWDEELTRKFDKEHPLPEQIRESFDNVNITVNNAKIIAPIKIKRLEDKKYDFKKYMHDNWKK